MTRRGGLDGNKNLPSLGELHTELVFPPPTPPRLRQRTKRTTLQAMKQKLTHLIKAGLLASGATFVAQLSDGLSQLHLAEPGQAVLVGAIAVLAWAHSWLTAEAAK